MFSKKKKPFNPYESARTMYFMKYGKRATAGASAMNVLMTY